MKRILLDTIAFDNLIFQPLALSQTARIAIANADEVLLCQISLVELSNHVRAGQIQINQPFGTFFNEAISELSVKLIDLQWDALEYMATFDIQIIEHEWTRQDKGKTLSGVKRELHKDPFDRLIIAHAITLEIPIVSPDTLFPFYEPLGLNVIWK